MQGKEYCQEFEESCIKLESLIEDFERANKDRTNLVEMLEQSELFYDTQYGEAKIVTNVRLICEVKISTKIYIVHFCAQPTCTQKCTPDCLPSRSGIGINCITNQISVRDSNA